MDKGIRYLYTSIDEHKVLWKAMGALSLGILLGALVAAPLDQALGLAALPYTAQLYTALQSLVATATLVRVRTVDRSELELELAAFPPVPTQP